MKKSSIIAALLIGASLNVKADSSCTTDCDVTLDPTTFSSMAWVNAPNSGFTVVGPDEWKGVGILSSGQPCNQLVGPTLNIFLSAPATNDIVVGTITITCQVGMIYTKQSQPIQLTVAQGSMFAAYQFFACQCDGKGACAVCACRNGAMYTPPANQGPPAQ